jgi:hypothetical protein
MALSLPAYFAGMATVVAAIGAGFGGGIMLTSATAVKEPSAAVAKEAKAEPKIAEAPRPTEPQAAAPAPLPVVTPTVVNPIPSPAAVEQALAATPRDQAQEGASPAPQLKEVVEKVEPKKPAKKVRKLAEKPEPRRHWADRRNDERGGYRSTAVEDDGRAVRPGYDDRDDELPRRAYVSERVSRDRDDVVGQDVSDDFDDED